MNQSTIPHKMLREYHPQLIDCLIQDAHLDILDWFFRGKIAFFTLNPKESVIYARILIPEHAY